MFLHGGGSSRPSSLFLYLCLFVDVDMVTKNSCSYVLSCVKTCVVSTVWQEIPQSFDPHFQPFSIRKCFYYEKFYYGWRGGVTGTFEDLCNSADDELFIKIRTSSNHILHALLPPPSTASQNYGLRQRVHSLQLPERSTHLSDSNFLMRMLYKNSY